jgi:hypothetical protein
MNALQLKTQKRIEKAVKNIDAATGIMEWWIVTHRFEEGMDGDTMMTADRLVSVNKTRAVTVATWQYREATVTWYLGACADLEDDELELICIHEYCHVFTSPLSSMIPSQDASTLHSSEHQAMVAALTLLRAQVEEFTTETLARVIQRARGYDTPV